MTDPTTEPRPTVLFVCVKNGGKSQMAAGLFRHHVELRGLVGLEAASAGTRAGDELNELSVESLAEFGVDITDQRPRQLTEPLVASADRVVTVGSDARVDPLPGPQYETWDIDEPSLRGIEGMERMRLVRDDIDRHVRGLLDRLTSG